MKARELINGVFQCSDEVEYVALTSVAEDGTIVPIKSIRLFGKYYMFNPSTMQLEEEDIVDEGVETISAQTSEVIRFEKNSYVKKITFDCAKENDQQSAAYQPISGLNIDSTYQTLKTHNFCNAKEDPITGDLIFYQGRFWIVEDTRKTFTYTPREKSVLHLSIKQIKK